MWWIKGDPVNGVVEYRMKIHLFGAVCSPGYTNVGLKRVVDDGEEEYGEEAAEFIRRNYKIASNKRDVFEVIASEDRAKGLKELDLKNDPLLLERAF